ncbi:hypothetical protein BH10ACI4_BH10ACI4_10500 [soil metagenome]
MKSRLLPAVLLAIFVFAPVFAGSQAIPAASSTSTSILNASQAGAIFPATVYFKGQSAPIQARNSAGVRFSKDSLMLAAIVDTSGYSSAVAERYQAYLLTDSTLDISGHRVAPGAYGFGFVAADTFVIMDLGGHELFTARTTKDQTLRRPNPLQILPAPGNDGAYRLYLGRSFIAFTQAR